MSDGIDRPMMRRTFLQLVGGCAVLPAAGLAGCSGDHPPPPEVAPPAPAPAPAPATAARDFFSQLPATPDAGEPGEEDGASGEPSAVRAGEPLGEDDPLAVALGYRHDASTVDAGEYPGWQDGQRCGGCTWFAGRDDTEWAACGLLSGALTRSGGWCRGFKGRT